MINEKEIRLEFNPHLYRHNVLYGNHDWGFDLNDISVNKIDHGNLKKERYCYNKKPFTGIFFTSYEDGKLKSEINIIDGFENGFERFYYENGKISIERIYKNGELISVKEFKEDGNLTSESTVNNEGFTVIRHYDEKGRVIFEDGIFSHDLNIPEEKKIFTRTYFEWFETNQIKQKTTLDCKTGVEQFESYYKNGQLKEKGITYKWEDEDGNEISDIKLGEWIIFYENGKLKQKSIYNKSISESLFYECSDLISEECFDEDGNKIECED